MSKLKQPLAMEEIKSLLKIHKLPDFLLEKINYKSNNLKDFYVGFNRIAIGEPINTSYKAIVKNLVVISKEITIPVKRNNIVIKDWIYSSLPNDIVVIINVQEEFFTIKDLNKVNYNLIGVFDKETFINQINDTSIYDEFTSFLDNDEVGESDDR